jgi:threonine dehydratase
MFMDSRLTQGARNLVDLESVRMARDIVRKYVPVSRLIRASSLTRAAGTEVYLKLECEGPTFSFKPRGAIYSLRRLLDERPISGVVTASSGNHGAAVAFAAKQMRLPATVFLPRHPNPVKRARIAEQDAQIVEAGDFVEESREHAAKYANERGWHNIVDGVTEGLAIGAGTIGCEIVEQLPDVDTIVVPVGDSSLIRGLGFAVKKLMPDVRLIGVQAERAPAYFRSWVARRAQSTDFSDTFADGLAIRHASDGNVREMLELVDEMHLVSDEEMMAAISRLLVDENIVAEPAGAATTAALLQGECRLGKKAVLLVTGANLRLEVLNRAVAGKLLPEDIH